MMRMYQEYLNHFAKIREGGDLAPNNLLSLLGQSEKPTLETVPAVLALLDAKSFREPMTFSEFEQIVRTMLKEDAP
jgi:hypothetical protein